MFVGKEDEIVVYACFFPSPSVCPGGSFGTCAPGREGIACGRCIAETYAVEESCVPCAGSAPGVRIATFGVVALLLIAACYFGINLKAAKRTHTVILAMTLCGLTISTMQQFSVFALLSIDWLEPVKSALQLARVFAFDLEVVRFSCLIPGTTEVADFAFSILVVVACVLATTGLHLCWLWAKGWPEVGRWDRLLAAVGSVFLAFYIVLALTTLSPFQCYAHPSGMWSMKKYPAVLCGSADHRTLEAIGGVTTILFPGLFIAVASYATQQFPHRFLQSDHAFLVTFNFLFLRATRRAYWFPCTLLLRNLLLAFVPTLENLLVQVVLMAFLLLVHILIVAVAFPWRVEVANVVDIALSVGAILLLLAACALGDFGDAASTISLVGTVALVIMFCGGLLGVGAVIYRKTRKSHYAFFLCHHKVDAGAFARLLKMKLAPGLREHEGVFIDSDNLVDLSTLFDIVKAEVRVLVVLGTKYVLSRPWCAGEIATAWCNNVRLCTVDLGDFQTAVETACQEVATWFFECEILTEAGITLHDLSSAFDSLTDGAGPLSSLSSSILALKTSRRSLPICGKIKTDAIPSHTDLAHVVGELHEFHRQTIVARNSYKPPMDAGTLLAVDPDHAEAVAASRVIELMTKEPVISLIHLPKSDRFNQGMRRLSSADLPMAVKHTCFLLSKDCFLSRAMISMLYIALTQTHLVLPVVVAKDFSFLTERDFEAIEAGTRRGRGPKLPQFRGLHVRIVVEQLFKKIAGSVDLHGSHAQIAAQVAALELKLRTKAGSFQEEEIQIQIAARLTRVSRRNAEAPTDEASYGEGGAEDTPSIAVEPSRSEDARDGGDADDTAAAGHLGDADARDRGDADDTAAAGHLGDEDARDTSDADDTAAAGDAGDKNARDIGGAGDSVTTSEVAGLTMPTAGVTRLAGDACGDALLAAVAGKGAAAEHAAQLPETALVPLDEVSRLGQLVQAEELGVTRFAAEASSTQREAVCSFDCIAGERM